MTTLAGQQSLVLNKKNYFFYRTKDNDKILVVIEDNSLNNQSHYSIVDKETFDYLAIKTGYNDYDNLTGC